jgi:hypothetical protein
MGCHRSGTNLLYDTLLSAGGFAVYRGYLPIYEILLPRFGSLENPANRQKLVETWMRSKGFKRAGLPAGPIFAKLLAECRSGGDFIRFTIPTASSTSLESSESLPIHYLCTSSAMDVTLLYPS